MTADEQLPALVKAVGQLASEVALLAQGLQQDPLLSNHVRVRAQQLGVVAGGVALQAADMLVAARADDPDPGRIRTGR